MNFLFSETIMSERGKCVYKLYEFKLAPGHYHAELISPINPECIGQINFQKDNGKWQTVSRLKNAKRLVELLGKAIDKMKN
jgi:hypothetical protein